MLELKNVVKEYDGKKVLKGISYTFLPGKVYFILGESGSGKTTLLKLISGLDNKYDGYIIYKNIDIKKLNKKEKRNYLTTSCAFIEQTPPLFNGLKGKTNLLFIEKNNKIHKKEKYNFLQEIKLSKKASKYSLGEKQRIENARSLNQNATVILADEPTSSLDKENKEKVIQELVKQKKNKIIIIVTHDEKMANMYGDEILLLEKGKIKKHKIGKSDTYLLEKDNKNISLKDSFAIAYEYQRSQKKENSIYVISLVMSLTLLIFTNFLSKTLIQYFKETVIRQSNQSGVIEVTTEEERILNSEDILEIEEHLGKNNVQKIYNTEDLETSFHLEDRDFSFNANALNLKITKEEKINQSEIQIGVSVGQKEKIEKALQLEKIGLSFEKYVENLYPEITIRISKAEVIFEKKMLLSKVKIIEECDFQFIHNCNIFEEDITRLSSEVIDYKCVDYDEKAKHFFDTSERYYLLVNDDLKIRKSTENLPEKTFFKEYILDELNIGFVDKQMMCKINDTNDEVNIKHFTDTAILYGRNLYKEDEKHILISKGLFDKFYLEKDEIDVLDLTIGGVVFSMQIAGVTKDEEITVFINGRTYEKINTSLYGNNFKKSINQKLIYVDQKIDYDDLLEIEKEYDDFKIKSFALDVLKEMDSTMSSLKLIVNVFVIFMILVAIITIIILNLLDYKKANKEYFYLYRVGYSFKDVFKIFIMKNTISTAKASVISAITLFVMLSCYSTIFNEMLYVRSFSFSLNYLWELLVYSTLILSITSILFWILWKKETKKV